MNCKNKPFRKRIGNDVGVTWRIDTAQAAAPWRIPYDLTGKVLNLELKHPRLGVVDLTDFSVEGNEVLWAFLGKDQQYTGVYTLTLWEGKGTETQRVIDAIDFLELVPPEAQIQECCHGEIESQYSTMGVDIVTIIDGADYETRSHAVAAFAPKAKTAEDIAALQSGKVDKEEGKGLSEANFTNGEKSKLGGIEAGAQKNIIEAVKVNGTARPVSGKAVDIPVPTKVGDLENDRGYTTPAVVSAAVLEESNRAKEAEGAIAGRVSVIESKESGWDGKQDALRSGENIKTINGQSILGGGNIEIQGGGSSVPVVDNLTSTSKTSALSANQGRALKGMIDGKQDAISDLSTIRSGAQDGTAALQSFSAIPSWAKQPQKPTYTAAEVNALPSSTTIPSKTSELTNDSGFLTTHQDISGKADKVQIATSNPSGGLLPNTLYNLGTLSGAVTIKLASAISGVASHYFVTFETGDTAPTITWGSGITSWFGGSAPTIKANKHYEVSVLNGVAIAMEV